MHFSLVADGRLLHLELPRGAGIADFVHGEADGQPIAIPTIEVLAHLRSIHGRASWSNSGARAHLTGGNPFPHTLEQGRNAVAVVNKMVDDGVLLDRCEPVTRRAGRSVRLEWQAQAPKPDGELLAKHFATRKDAERWVQRRALADNVGWNYLRTDVLLDDAQVNPTIDELFDLADLAGRPVTELIEGAGR